MDEHTPLLAGTLDLLVLKAVSLGELHGYGVLLRIQQISHGALAVEQGALYPALYRLVRRKWLKARWGTSDNNRQAKFYSLTPAGRRRLLQEQAGWRRLSEAIGAALGARAGLGSPGPGPPRAQAGSGAQPRRGPRQTIEAES